MNTPHLVVLSDMRELLEKDKIRQNINLVSLIESVSCTVLLHLMFKQNGFSVFVWPCILLLTLKMSVRLLVKAQTGNETCFVWLFSLY